MVSELYIKNQVKNALEEDLGEHGDITSLLINQPNYYEAILKTNMDMVVCGIDWVNEVFKQVDDNLKTTWYVREGEHINKNSHIFSVLGNAKSILIAERTALNFFQLLSGIATYTSLFVNKVKGCKALVYDTRKTIPGLRLAQKYAVTVGGGRNQRFGLYDSVLIKENHIICSKSINDLVNVALDTYKSIPIQVEVENYNQLQLVVNLGVKNVLLDNMSLNEIKQCVIYCQGNVELEVSGGINLDNILDYANTGVDRISIGALTKNIYAVDLSLRFKDV